MSIQFSDTRQVFTLHTDRSTYQMKIGSYGYLMHLYYGEKIEDEDTDYLITYYDRGFSPNPNEAGNDRTFSLDAIPQEYSSCGVGDYRISSMEVRNGDGSRIFSGKYAGHRIYKGKYTLEGLPHIWENDGDTVDTLEIDLKDMVSGVKVTLLYSVFEEKDVIARSVKVTNEGQEEVKLNRVMSMNLDFTESDFDFIHFDGRHTMEREIHRCPLNFGIQSVGSCRGTSSHQHNPFTILCKKNAQEDYGECYGFSFVYSGNFICEVEKDQYDQTRVAMGIHPQQFRWMLSPGETFTAPETVMAYSDQGLTGLSHIYHDIFRDNLCRSKFVHQPRPVLINSWEAVYFDFNHAKLMEIAKAAKDLGVDLFVLDDGWFGNRNNDSVSLGDWTENKEKLPRGLAGLAEDLKKEGLKFGLWLEPEMISENSRLYEEHPDWCLHVPGRPVTRGRYQLVLDLSRKDVCDYIVKFIEDILGRADISYIKWDMNRSISDVWSSAADSEHQGETGHKYVLGLYDILERVTSAFPDVLFEGCSGGGGRFDPGMLYYHPQIWCSDNTDALNRLKIQYGTSFGYPISTMGSHVSVCPNHQTGRVVPFKTRGVVAMSGTYGYELDISKMTPEERKECRKMTEDYRKYQKLIFEGDYYRLSNPHNCHGIVAWAFVSKDKQEALVNIVLTDKEANDAQRYVKVRGLDSDAYYYVEGNDRMMSGQLLRRVGIPVPGSMKEYEALQFKLVRQ